MKTMIVALALSLVTLGVANAQTAGRGDNPFSRLSQAECTADKGAVWKESETWTRQSDGKVRTSKARCAFDAKAGRIILGKALVATKR